MSKTKGKISVERATYLAWLDTCEQCRINGIKEIIHMNTFIDRVRAYVNGGSLTGVQVATVYRPMDGQITRRLRELKEGGLLDYEYKDEVYYNIPIKPMA